MNPAVPVTNRVFWIDLIRVVSAFFVVTIHVSHYVASGHERSGMTLGWLVSLCYQDFCVVAVPLFIMISGALLLGRNEDLPTFYRKRFGKILWAFLAWCGIYILCRWFSGLTLNGEVPITLTSSIGAVLFPRNASGHFWFIPMLLSLYLVTPFLSVFVRNASKIMLDFFLILWILAIVIFPVINKVAIETLSIARIDFRFEFVSYWLGFFIVGYILKECVISKRWAMIAAVFWFFLSIAPPTNVYLRAISSDPTLNTICDFCGSYIFPIISHQIVFSLLAFLVLRSLGNTPSLASSRFGRTISFVAPLTFGIYLSHMLLVSPMMKKIALGACEAWFVVLFAIPACAVCIYLASGGVIYLIRKIRYLKFLAP